MALKGAVNTLPIKPPMSVPIVLPIFCLIQSRWGFFGSSFTNHSFDWSFHSNHVHQYVKKCILFSGSFRIWMKLQSSHTVSCFGQKGPVTVSGLEYVKVTFSFSKKKIINMLLVLYFYWLRSYTRFTKKIIRN